MAAAGRGRAMSVEEAMSVAESYQAQLEGLETERQTLLAIEAECETTRRALDALAAGKPEDVLVPLGAGTFVHARLSRTDRIVTPVGAGVHVAMAPDAARETLQTRAGEARRAREGLEGAMSRIQSQLEQLVGQIRAAQGAAGASPPGPGG